MPTSPAPLFPISVTPPPGGSLGGGSPVSSTNKQLDFSSIDWGNVGSEMLGWLKDNWQGLVKAGLATATTVEAIKNSQAANNYTSKALGTAQSDYDSRAPFRTAAVGKLAATRPDLSNIFADPGNPYKSVNRSIPAVGSQFVPPGGTTGQIPPTSWPGAPGGPPFVETPTTNGPPAGMPGNTPVMPSTPGTPTAPTRPIAINPPAASGRIPRLGQIRAVGSLSRSY